MRSIPAFTGGARRYKYANDPQVKLASVPAPSLIMADEAKPCAPQLRYYPISQAHIHPHVSYKIIYPLSHMVHRIPPPTQPAPTLTLSLAHPAYLPKPISIAERNLLITPPFTLYPPFRNLHHIDFAGQCLLHIPRTLPYLPPLPIPFHRSCQLLVKTLWMQGGGVLRPPRKGRHACLQMVLYYFPGWTFFSGGASPRGGWRRSQCSSAHLETLC